VGHGVDHVGVYLGDGKVIHATAAAGGVVLEDLETSAQFKNTVGYRRVATRGERRMVVTVPFERLDIRQPADLIEEIGRVYGYEYVPATPLPLVSNTSVINPNVYWMERVRGVLDALGFTEIMTYSLRAKGELALANAMASDKSYLRDNLGSAMEEALDKNEYYLPLTGEKELKLYEIGRVFKASGESVHVAMGVRAQTGKNRDGRTKDILNEAQAAITVVFGTSLIDVKEENGIIEFNLGESIKTLALEESEYPKNSLVDMSVVYTPISAYPFVLRDIALWVPTQTASSEVSDLIRQQAGELLVRLDQFDSFEKEGRVSYAFHLVFQSSERTLEDTEVTTHMEHITNAITAQGWEIR
jgi:phenylalanyl-tRNA synthetase beta chain